MFDCDSDAGEFSVVCRHSHAGAMVARDMRRVLDVLQFGLAAGEHADFVNNCFRNSGCSGRAAWILLRALHRECR